MRSFTLFLFTCITISTCSARAGKVNLKQEWQQKNAYQEHSATRQKICLNGRWKIKLLTADELKKFIPAAKSKSPAKKISLRQQLLDNIKKINRKTTEIKQSYPENICKSNDESKLHIYTPGLFYALGSRQTGLRGLGLKNAKQASWGAIRKLSYNGKNIKEYFGAIYKREISISTPDKNYFIQLDNVKNKAIVYVNGRFAGTSEGREATEIPIRKFLKSGVNLLQFLVVSNDKQRGLIGDTWLLQHPTRQFIRDAFLETADFTTKKLTLNIALKGKTEGEFEVVFVPVRKNEERLVVQLDKLNPSSKKVAKNSYFTATFKLPKVKAWKPEANPNLYKCTVRWKSNGKIIDETVPFNFGLRQLKISGRDYILNNKKFHFRNFAGMSYLTHIEKENYKRHFAELKKANINCVSLWNPDTTDEIFSLADEQGVMLNVYLYGIKANYTNWNNTKVREKVKKQLLEHLKMLQNHPSVVHYFIEPGLLPYPQDYSPYGMAHDKLIPKENYDSNHAQAGPAFEYEKWLKTFDPHKAVLQYAGGAYGDVYSTMIYLDFVRLQDKKNWLNGWAKTGTKPFYAIEMGMPWDSSYYHDHTSSTVKPRKTEPMIAEYCAIDLGDSVYAMDNKKWYRKQFACKVKPQAQNGNDFYVGGSSLFYQYWRPGRPHNLLLHERLLFVQTVRAWRYRNISGFTPWAYAEMIADNSGVLESKTPASYKNYKTPGLKPFYQLNSHFTRNNDNYKALTKSMADRLIFIADKDTLRIDHSYYNNEPISKKIVFINDGKSVNATFTINVTQQATGKVIFRKKITMFCPQGEKREKIFSFKGEKLQHRSNYKINVSAKIGEKIYQDQFAVEVFPAVSKITKNQKRCLLYNPKNDSVLSEQFKVLGINCLPYKLGETINSQSDILIIARNALNYLTKDIGEITNFVKKGGKVLVMEQSATVLNKLFKLKTLHLNTRKLFKSFDHKHSFNELKNVDLKNWRGNSNFLPLDNTWLKKGDPRHIWKISQEGIVASLLIQRPHTGPYRSHLNAGFDLDYSAFLELSIGQGKIFFCQLDISSRNAKNPNSVLALRSIVKMISQLQTQNKRQSLIYIGSDPQVLELIKTLKVKHLKTVSKNNHKNSVMLLGAITSDREIKKAERHLKNGGTVVFTARKNLSSLPKQFNVPAATKLDDYTLSKLPPMPLLSGLTLGDFYWKDYYRYKGFNFKDNFTPIIAVKALNGTAVFCQVDPYVFGRDPIVQRQMRAQQKKLRIIANLLNNLNVEFESQLANKTTEGNFDGLTLENKWGFKLDPQNQGEKLAYPSGFKASRKLNPTDVWENQGVKNKNRFFTAPKHPSDYDGIAWYKQHFIIPASAKGEKLYFRAQIDDYDVTWFNGVKIGETDKKTKNAYRQYRKYLIPEKLIKYGRENIITIKVNDIGFGGGLWADRRMKVKIGIFPDKTNKGPYRDAQYDYDPYLFKRW
jgi:beta-galactosidase